MPAQDGVWRHDGRDLRTKTPPKGLALRSEPATLIIVELESLAAKLLLQDPILFEEVVNDVGLLAVDATGERGEEEPEPEEVRHRER